MQNAVLTEAERGAIGAAWAAIRETGRADAEGQLLGSVIVGVYPVNSCRVTAAGEIETYQAGIAILYRQGSSPEIKTAIIENSCSPGTPEDAVNLLFYDCMIYPEESIAQGV